MCRDVSISYLISLDLLDNYQLFEPVYSELQGTVKYTNTALPSCL